MGTNNTAELNALYHALRTAEARIKTGNTVEVCSDSAYSIMAMLGTRSKKKNYGCIRKQ